MIAPHAERDAGGTGASVRAIRDAVRAMGEGPVTEDAVREHLFPLFLRVLARNARSGEVYLANHSLGRPMDAVAEDIAEALGLWYRDLGDAWGPWMAEIDAFRARVAGVIGCGRPDAVVPKTSAGQGVRAVLNALPMRCPRVVATRAEFDSIDAILKVYAHKGRASVRWIGTDETGLVREPGVLAAIDAGADLVVISAVCFATGQVVEGLGDIVKRAHERGALVVVDAYHAAGAVPIDFDALGCDFMIGGSYKYTRGGPGACWVAVHPRHLRDAGEPAKDGVFTLDTGWFAKEDPFAYARGETPRLAAGGDAWLESTPPVLTFYQARSGLELTLAIGVERLRAYNLAQQQRLIDALTGAGVRTRVIEPRGAYVLVPVVDGPAAIDAMALAGVASDARPCPSGNGWYARLCPDLLTTGDEISLAADRVARALR